MRYLGVDYGSKRIGLALSDEAGMMGFPYSIVPNTPKLLDEVCALIAKENIGVVVIGESRSLSGGENPIAKDARAAEFLVGKPGGGESLGEAAVVQVSIVFEPRERIVHIARALRAAPQFLPNFSGRARAARQ